MTWKEGVNYTLMNLADDAVLGGAVSSSKHRKLTQKGPSEIRNVGRKRRKELRLGQMRARAAGTRRRQQDRQRWLRPAKPSQEAEQGLGQGSALGTML